MGVPCRRYCNSWRSDKLFSKQLFRERTNAACCPIFSRTYVSTRERIPRDFEGILIVGVRLLKRRAGGAHIALIYDSSMSGGSPSAISMAVMPRLQTSTEQPYSVPCTTVRDGRDYVVFTMVGGEGGGQESPLACNNMLDLLRWDMRRRGWWVERGGVKCPHLPAITC